MISRLRVPIWAMIVAIYLTVLMSSPAIAELIASAPSPSGTLSPIRGEEISRIQRALENRILVEKLNAYGLTAGEVRDKLRSMSDDQVHMLAQASNRLLEGGDDGLGIIIALLVIVLLFIVILKLMNKEIIIK